MCLFKTVSPQCIEVHWSNLLCYIRLLSLFELISSWNLDFLLLEKKIYIDLFFRYPLQHKSTASYNSSPSKVLVKRWKEINIYWCMKKNSLFEVILVCYYRLNSFSSIYSFDSLQMKKILSNSIFFRIRCVSRHLKVMLRMSQQFHSTLLCPSSWLDQKMVRFSHKKVSGIVTKFYGAINRLCWTKLNIMLYY